MPSTPPSAVAAVPIEKMSFCESIKVMWANKNFMLLSIAYALIYGIYCAVGSTTSNLLSPFGFSPHQISIGGGIAMLSGVVGALLVAIFVDYTSWYRKTHLTLSILIVCSILYFYIMMHSREAHIGHMITFCVFFGFSSVSFFPIGMSYAAELTFPLRPALVNACMNFFGQVCCFFTIGLSALVTDVDATNFDSVNNIDERKKNSIIVCIIFGSFSSVTLLLSCFIKEDLRRVNFKKKKTDQT